MTMLGLLLCAGLLVQEPAAGSAAVARVPESFLHVRLDLPGLKTGEASERHLKAYYARKGVLHGTLPAHLATLLVLAERHETPMPTGAQARDKVIGQHENVVQVYEHAGIACAEVKVALDGTGSHDLHAFFVAGGYRFQLSLFSALYATKGEPISRAMFAPIVESFRVAVLRRGQWEDHEPRVLELMHSALTSREGWRKPLEAAFAEAPEDALASFVEAELARHYGKPASDLVEAYRRATARLGALEEPSRAGRFALMTAWDGLGIAQLDTKDVEGAVASLRRAREMGLGLRTDAVHGVSYNLACALARGGQAEEAVDLLAKVAAFDSTCISRAAQDPDFAALRETPRFQAFVRGELQ